MDSHQILTNNDFFKRKNLQINIHCTQQMIYKYIRQVMQLLNYIKFDTNAYKKKDPQR